MSKEYKPMHLSDKDFRAGELYKWEPDCAVPPGMQGDYYTFEAADGERFTVYCIKKITGDNNNAKD